MNAKIEFDTRSNRHFGYMGGRVVVRSASRDYVERKLNEMGATVTTVEDPIKADVPKMTFSVAQRFHFIGQFVNLVASGRLNSFILTGSGGLGKTHSVLEGLKAKGMTEDTIGQPGEFIFIRGYSTAKALYRTLWENNGKIIIFDDADSVHKDPIGANILKAALGSENKRVISWGAEFAESESLPNRFEFIGRVVFISNLSQTQFPQALLSRSQKVDLTLTTGEKLERITEVFKNIKGEDDEKAEVLEFINTYAEVATDLNIRSALNILKLKRDIGEDWEGIALYSFTS